jgi:hypothetical protein
MKIDSKPSDDNAGHEFTEANIRIRIDELAEVDPGMRASRYSSSMNGVEMLTELQKILWQEERDSYLQSVTPSETSNAGTCCGGEGGRAALLRPRCESERRTNPMRRTAPPGDHTQQCGVSARTVSIVGVQLFAAVDGAARAQERECA